MHGGDGNRHEHGHGHGHKHSHEHSHEHEKSPDKTVAVMSYMLEHNKSHAGELAVVAEKLESDGKSEAAALLREGVVLLGQGNEKLASALKILGRG